MNKIINLFRNKAFQIGLILILIKYVLESFKSNGSPDSLKLSNNSKVQSVINQIDHSIDAFGTFNSDHEPIFNALKSLSKTEIILLHKDFGFRFWNPILMQYKIISTGSFRGYTIKKDLNSLFQSEFDNEQLEMLNSIYKSKSLKFPLLI